MFGGRIKTGALNPAALPFLKPGSGCLLAWLCDLGSPMVGAGLILTKIGQENPPGT
jgi:hypothetical protein